MTAIATDGKTIAADSMMTFGRERCINPIEKIAVEGQMIFATAGVPIKDALIDWFTSGSRPHCAPRSTEELWYMLVIDPKQMLFLSSQVPYPVPVEAPFAFGAGGEYAMGAMLNGASPKEAVEIAIKASTACGGPVQVIDIAEALGLKGEGVLEAAE